PRGANSRAWVLAVTIPCTASRSGDQFGIRVPRDRQWAAVEKRFVGSSNFKVKRVPSNGTLCRELLPVLHARLAVSLDGGSPAEGQIDQRLLFHFVRFA